MDTWLIIVIVVFVLLDLLAIGGWIATRRRTRAGDAALLATVASVNDALAAAHAEDKGWEPARLQEAAREAFTSAHPGVEPETLQLVHVDDRPGIANDRAIFKVVAAGAEHDLVLGREGDGWVTVEA